jgi:Mrp family chromosome partitioning ATPase
MTKQSKGQSKNLHKERILQALKRIEVNKVKKNEGSMIALKRVNEFYQKTKAFSEDTWVEETENNPPLQGALPPSFELPQPPKETASEGAGAALDWAQTLQPAVVSQPHTEAVTGASAVKDHLSSSKNTKEDNVTGAEDESSSFDDPQVNLMGNTQELKEIAQQSPPLKESQQAAANGQEPPRANNEVNITTAENHEASVTAKVYSKQIECDLSDRRLFLVHYPQSKIAASFRILRHRILEQGNPQKLIVTSALEKEGKTTCAVNLAMALAEFHHAKVLLIDTNFYHPSISDIFGMKQTACLLKQLSLHQSDPQGPWMVADINWYSLHVLAIDPSQPNAAEGVDWHLLQKAIQDFSKLDYQYLIFDTPAVLGKADVNFMQEVADKSVFTIFAGRTRVKNLELAMEQLMPQNVLGVVMLYG